MRFYALPLARFLVLADDVVDHAVFYGLLGAHYGVRHLIVHRGAQEDDPVLQQPRVDVHGPLPARALLDHVRYDRSCVVVHARSSPCVCSVCTSPTRTEASTLASPASGPASSVPGTSSSGPSSSSSSGIGTGTAFSARKSSAFCRVISSSRIW